MTQFATNLADALGERGTQPEMKKMMKQWKKTLTKSQKHRLDDLNEIALPKLRQEARALAKKAPAGIRSQIEHGISLLAYDALTYLMLDLEYGVVGSMPPSPLKISVNKKAIGKSIKFGSRTMPAKEGVITDVAMIELPDSPASFLVFISDEKKTEYVTAEQVIGVGTFAVQMTFDREQPVHPFNDPAKNSSAPTIPEAVEK